MNRQEFIQLFGLGAASLLASVCLGGCGSSSSGPITADSGVDFTVDLAASSSADLNNASVGYVYNAARTVIVAKTTAGTYVAFQAPCPHEGFTVYFAQSQSRFICPKHNAVFDTDGNVVSGPVSRALKQYTVTQTGNTLRVTG